MKFTKYQHIERLGTEEVQGIEKGTVQVFPKLDGSNGSIWYHNDIVCAGSRNRQISLDNDNHGFMKWVEKHKYKFIGLFQTNPSLVLYGEWLVPHRLKTYEKTAWREFYVFDVTIGGEHLPYDTYKHVLSAFAIQSIPPIVTFVNPTNKLLEECLDLAGFLIPEGKGEGVVVKNYSFKNKYGRTTWAKLINKDFKQPKKRPLSTHLTTSIEAKIIKKFLTDSIIEKCFLTVKQNHNNEWRLKYLSELISTVFYTLIKEESWSFIKHSKLSKIDFKLMSKLSAQKVKHLLPSLYTPPEDIPCEVN